VPTVETWARRLASVETLADGSRVWAEIVAAGADCPALADVAKSRLGELTVTKN
jgi:hypothetical protein